LTAASTDEAWTAEQRAGQAANLLGALSLAMGDRLAAAIGAASGLAPSDATALSALHHFLDRPRVDLMAQVLGLTSSGTVRLVDRLERAGLVRRTTGDDGRVTSVSLTAAGRRRALAVTRARGELLRDALAPLTADERERFGELAGRILAGLVRPPGATRWMCRLCDIAGCGRPEGRCPVAAAAEARRNQDRSPGPRD
jgi:DNA-binding MarR family transcriptional regulator